MLKSLKHNAILVGLKLILMFVTLFWLPHRGCTFRLIYAIVSYLYVIWHPVTAY